MNRNLEEQKIRQLFREARQQDDALAPSYADTLAAARGKTPPADWRLPVWPIAFATLALIAIGITALVFYKQSKTQPPGPIAVGPTVALPRGHSAAPPSANPSKRVAATPSTIRGRRANIKPSPRRPRPGRPQSDFSQAALLSLKWQSPTDFLLRTPGADLLKTVPRLGDSLIRFDVIPSDEKN
jgi:hypothetical protein